MISTRHRKSTLLAASLCLLVGTLIVMGVMRPAHDGQTVLLGVITAIILYAMGLGFILGALGVLPEGRAKQDGRKQDSR